MLIMVVTRERLVYRVISFIAAQAWNCEVVQATGAEEALVRVVNEPFGLVVVDVELPDADGVELAERLHALPDGDRPPVFLTSAFAEPRRHNGDHFFTRLIDPEDFIHDAARYPGDPDASTAS